MIGADHPESVGDRPDAAVRPDCKEYAMPRPLGNLLLERLVDNSEYVLTDKELRARRPRIGRP